MLIHCAKKKLLVIKMIKTIKGDVLSIKEGIILHSCNDQGIMGAGIAYQIKERLLEYY